MLTKIYLVICICASICQLSAQGYKKIDLDLDGEYIDIVSLEDDHVHLISSKGIYDFNILTPTPIAILKGKAITPGSQNYTYNDKVYFYPLQHDGYLSYYKNQKVLKLENGSLDDGIVIETRNGHRWLANNSLFKNVDGKWKHKLNITSFSTLTDGKAYKDNIWLCSRSEGVFKIDFDLKMEQYDIKKGLMSNKCTSLFVIDDANALVGHAGGYSKITPEGIEKVMLAELGSEPIIEMERDNVGKLWILTRTKLINCKDGHVTVTKLQLGSAEQLKGIHLGSDQNIWLLSNQSIYAIPNTEIEVYDIPRSNKNSSSLLDFYQIRKKNYLSNGKKVFSLDEKSNQWIAEKKKDAPANIIVDKDGHPNLIFKNNKGIKLNSKNAKLINKIAVPESEELVNINRIQGRSYYSTKANLYEIGSGELKLVSHKEDLFYKVVETDNGIFAFAQNGVYKMQDDKIIPLLATYQNTTYPFTINQFQLGQKLITIKENSIQAIDIYDESIQEIPVRPLEILDIKVNGTLVWLFCSKSIVALDKEKLSQGKAAISKVIPIYEDNLHEGQMYKQSDEEIWAMGTEKVFRINVNDPITSYTPKMKLFKILNSEGEELKASDGQEINVQSSDFPINLAYNGTNFWTDKISYAYHLNYDGKNISEWSAENSYTLNNQGSGRYTLNAKFKDDIYGVNVHAKEVVLKLSDYGGSTSSKGKKKWLPIIVISSLILCFLYFLTRRKSTT